MSYSKLRCALFSLSDSYRRTAFRNAIQWAPEGQRMSIVRDSGMSWNTLLELDNSRSHAYVSTPRYRSTADNDSEKGKIGFNISVIHFLV